MMMDDDDDDGGRLRLGRGDEDVFLTDAVPVIRCHHQMILHWNPDGLFSHNPRPNQYLERERMLCHHQMILHWNHLLHPSHHRHLASFLSLPNIGN